MNTHGAQLSSRSYETLTICFVLSQSLPVTVSSTSSVRVLKVISIPLSPYASITHDATTGRSPTQREEDRKTVAVYLTKKTVSLQNDSSQLGPGTTSAHKGNRWWGRVTLRVKRNSRLAAVTSVSSRMTQEEVKSGVNLATKDSSSWTSILGTRHSNHNTKFSYLYKINAYTKTT